MTGFKLHPEAYQDLDEIRSYIAENNPGLIHRLFRRVSFQQVLSLLTRACGARTVENRYV